jgi:hypothetical protein
MKSLFPGLDPYIEARGLWEDCHPRLIAQIGGTRELQGVVAERLCPHEPAR